MVSDAEGLKHHIFADLLGSRGGTLNIDRVPVPAVRSGPAHPIHQVSVRLRIWRVTPLTDTLAGIVDNAIDNFRARAVNVDAAISRIRRI